MAELKFEEALKKLEKIVDDLENGELSLDEALKKYEEGVKLAQSCSQTLSAAQRKVELLMKKDDKFDLEKFDDADTGEEK